MRLFVCGARGSTPAPGHDFAGYGGHTSCVALSHDSEPPRLVIDAGTGIRNVTRLLDGRPFSGTILLGHLHWDHTEGLPFFAGADREGARVEVVMPGQGDAEHLFERFMSPPFFPIGPRGLRGRWSFRSIDEGRCDIEGFSVLACGVPHKGGRTMGFRISDGHAAFTYISDHSPTSLGPGPQGLGELHPAALQLADGADLLIHDAQHTAEEFPEVAHFGHCSMEYALALAEAAGVRRLLLFHHSPARTDAELDLVVASLPASEVRVEAAREGAVFDL